MLKNLSFIIKTSQDFIRTNEDNPPECDKIKLNSFFEAISDSYIPLLQMFERLQNDNVAFKIGLVLPPVLCSMLEDEKIQQLYVDFLDKRIALGKKELNRCKDNSAALELATAALEKNKELKKTFSDLYNKNILAQFVKFQKSGLIEILGTCATDIFMPYYADLPEAISAQIEMGLQSYKKCFGELPEGFYLPEFGYTPGIEKLIRAYGYSYTILHNRSILLTDNPPANGIFYPVRIENSLVAFTADTFIQDQIFAEDGLVQMQFTVTKIVILVLNLILKSLHLLWKKKLPAVLQVINTGKKILAKTPVFLMIMPLLANRPGKMQIHLFKAG